ncbi:MULTISPECIES: hypothetical protein [Xanthomonas]|uniref:hypothetical protein n=1 Tax=Xanthomonas TaxID=338 RepID=UPI000E1EDDCA|nr:MULTISPECIES: hypothetical protein [Xanthomonas]
MKESPEQEDLRRAISGELTKRINDAARYPNVRSTVIQALGTIQDRIASLCIELRDRFMLRADQPLARFYIKGGNAFTACMDLLQGHDQHLFDSGSSDWDTQVAIDPWLPGSVQDALHAEIEDIVVDEMKKAGVLIAFELSLLASDASPLAQQVYPIPRAQWPPHTTDVGCLLKCDEPQTFRRVFDRDRTGLSAYTGVEIAKLGERDMPSPPGIVLNDGIKPFVLYRLGYTWHATLIEGYPDHIVSQPASPRGILMELIDVSVPRRDTIEAIAIWSEIGNGHLTIATAAGQQERWQLPLPDLDYHLRENLLMLCEIASDPLALGAHKEAKRRERVAAIHAWYASIAQLPHFQGVLAGMAGRHVGALGDDAATLVNALMASVRTRTTQAAPDYANGQPTDATRARILAARHGTGTLLTLLSDAFTAPVLLSAAFSDDLLLMNTLAQSPYLAVDQLRFSGVDMAAVARVSYKQLQALDIAAFEHAVGQWLGEDVQVLAQPHNTPRVGGISYECTLVVFVNAKQPPFEKTVLAFLTLTTATDAQAPFHSGPAGQGSAYAALLDIDGQRKAAAALVEEFVLRERLSKQHDAIKTLLPQA